MQVKSKLGSVASQKTYTFINLRYPPANSYRIVIRWHCGTTCTCHAMAGTCHVVAVCLFDIFTTMWQFHIVIWQMLFIIHSFGNLRWSPAIQWFLFESNIYCNIFTIKAILIIIYFLLCFTSACYPLAIADTLLASVGVSIWQFIVIWQEVYMYTTCI